MSSRFISLLVVVCIIVDSVDGHRRCKTRRKCCGCCEAQPPCKCKAQSINQSVSPTFPPSVPPTVAPSGTVVSPTPTVPSATSKVTEPKTTTLLAATTKNSLRGNCTTPECNCRCEMPKSVKNGKIFGQISLNGPFGKRDTHQCACTQGNSYTTIFVPARETSSISQILTYHQIQTTSDGCLDLCILSEDGIFYNYPKNNSDQIIMNYYCDDNSDPKSCSFYAFFYSSEGNPQNITLISDDGKRVYHNRNNTESLGKTSSYLKVLAASCSGCCNLSGSYVVSTCSPPGVFVRYY